jgi:hypothetical protein
MIGLDCTRLTLLFLFVAAFFATAWILHPKSDRHAGLYLPLDYAEVNHRAQEVLLGAVLEKGRELPSAVWSGGEIPGGGAGGRAVRAWKPPDAYRYQRVSSSSNERLRIP